MHAPNLTGFKRQTQAQFKCVALMTGFGHNGLSYVLELFHSSY